MNNMESNTQANDSLGFFVAEFEEQIQEALANKLITQAVREIHDVWIELGRPTEPADNPHTSVKGQVMTWLESYDIPDMPEDEADILAGQYNKAQRQLLELTGIWYAGGESWHTYWNKGSAGWEEYKERSREIADNWINNRLWDVFCASLPEEE